MPLWLQQVIEISRTKRGSIKIKLTSIQVFLNIISGEDDDEDEIPLSMIKLKALCLPKSSKHGAHGEGEESPASPQP